MVLAYKVFAQQKQFSSTLCGIILNANVNNLYYSLL